MKRIISLALGMILATGMSVVTCAETSAPMPNHLSTAATIVPSPRSAYEDAVRTFSKKGSSWTSSKYYCVSGDRFGGGIEDPVKMSGKIQFSTSTSGPWRTISSDTLNGSGMAVNVSEKGWYRFVLSNPNSYPVEVECFVIVN